jgi:hypothetical protein
MSVSTSNIFTANRNVLFCRTWVHIVGCRLLQLRIIMPASLGCNRHGNIAARVNGMKMGL